MSPTFVGWGSPAYLARDIDKERKENEGNLDIPDLLLINWGIDGVATIN